MGLWGSLVASHPWEVETPVQNKSLQDVRNQGFLSMLRNEVSDRFDRECSCGTFASEVPRQMWRFMEVRVAPVYFSINL